MCEICDDKVKIEKTEKRIATNITVSLVVFVVTKSLLCHCLWCSHLFRVDAVYFAFENGTNQGVLGTLSALAFTLHRAREREHMNGIDLV